MNRDGRRGIVLALVLVLALLLSAAIMTFTRRSLVDAKIARNRDAAAQAEALARGGVQLATAVLLQDLIDEQNAENSPEIDTPDDTWVRADGLQLETPDGSTLSLSIEDTGSRLNLNALVDALDPMAQVDDEAVEYLADLLSKVIPEVDLPPGERFYEARELAENLLDYIDANDERISGGSEDDYYLGQNPPYAAANRPLLSVDELHLIEGFDEELVDALRPYVTVYPLVAAPGINLNTAPPHVLAAVSYGLESDRRLASAETVRRILKIREDGGIICDQHETDPTRCTPTVEVLEGSVYPPVSLPSHAGVFTVKASATARDIVRTVEAVIDRTQPDEPRLLFWRLY